MKMVLLSLALLFYENAIQAQQMNGFDLSNTAIPTTQILSGGPPRDGIPSIDHPKFQPVDQHLEFGKNNEVLGVIYNGVAKAYPITILDWHEIVNDHFNGKPIVITYCPLCGSGIAFESAMDGAPVQFGVSGLLYNSDVLLYDRKTSSLWSQILAEAISGSMKGKKLKVVPTQRMKLGTWKTLYPESLVLTTDTGYNRDYTQGPYGDYDHHNRTYFPLTNEDDTFHKKEWIFGIELNGAYKAYPIPMLKQLDSNSYQDSLRGTSFTLTWNQNGENLQAHTEDGREIIGLQMFWFAWVAFHPETLIMKE